MHYLGVNSLGLDQTKSLFDEVTRLKKKAVDQSEKYLIDKTCGILFFENSTRTKISFIKACQMLGLNYIDIDINTTSLKKGENLIDTILTLEALGIDMLIVRHHDSFFPKKLAKYSKRISIINAGDGTNAHPSQALTDAYTILDCFKTFNVTLAMIGDVINSRVAKSNIELLTKLGVEIKLFGPRKLLPDIDYLVDRGIIKDKNKVIICQSIEEAVTDVNIIMALRLQKERISEGVLEIIDNYYQNYGVSESLLNLAQENVRIMHPGPQNRDFEIESNLIEKQDISLIFQQVKNSVYARMALIKKIIDSNNKVAR